MEVAFKEYRAQLKELLPRLKSEAPEFFWQADVHDGCLLEVNVTDTYRVLRQKGEVAGWAAKTYTVEVQLSVCEARQDDVWTLYYRNVRHATIEYPDPAFNIHKPLYPAPFQDEHLEGENEEISFDHHIAYGFGDWGYHELTDAGNGFFSHEILFASGSTLLFEFKDVIVTRVHLPHWLEQRRLH